MLLNRIFALSVAASIAFAPAIANAQAFNPPATTYAYGAQSNPIGPIAGGLLGAYSKSMQSGTIAAALAANSPVFAFRYGGSGIAVIRRVSVTIGDVTTAFGTGGGSLQMFSARAFTASDTGGTAGTLTGNNSKLRTSQATTGISQIMIATTGTMTAGTRTLDTDPMASLAIGWTTAAGAQVLPQTTLYEPGQAGDYPLELANNEGFVIQANAAATGTWSLQVRVDWEEYSAFTP